MVSSVIMVLAMPQKTYEIAFTPLNTDLEKVDIDKFQQALSIRYIGY